MTERMIRSYKVTVIGRRGSKTSAQIAYFRPGTVRLGLYGPYEVLARVTLQTDILYACDSPSIMITPS